MVLPNTFYLDKNTNTLTSKPRTGSSGPYNNTWNPQDAAKQKLESAKGNLSSNFSQLGSLAQPRGKLRTAVTAGLGLAGHGATAAAANVATNLATDLAGSNERLKGFINFGPIGAIFPGLNSIFE